MHTAHTTKQQKAVAGIALLGLTGAIIVACAIPTSSSVATTEENPASASTPTKSTVRKTQDSNTKYKDGTYTAVGQYFSPGGKESLRVSLTLIENTVTTAAVTPGANDPTAVSYQTLFISGYKSKVVGKKLSDIKLTNVSGSSLTSQGFNSALNTIKQQAEI